MAAIVAKTDAPAAAPAAKKGKKTVAANAPRFGRIRSNLKMGVLGLPNGECF